MAMPKIIKSLGRFLKNIFKHPGSWISASLIALGVAFAMPALAAGFVIAALACTVLAIPLLILQARNFKRKDFGDRKNLSIGEFIGKRIKAHPVQFGVIVLALLLLVTALVLTIGFFTGGVAFAFMGPLFAAIAAPFATAATSLGISLGLPVLAGLAGFYFTIAALNFPNALKRFLAWLDSFKYDAAVALSHDEDGEKGIDWSDKATALAKVDELLEHLKNKYPHTAFFDQAVFFGIFETAMNGFSSRYAERLEAAAEKKANPSINEHRKVELL